MAPVLAEVAVNTTGMVNPIRTAGGSRVTWPAVVRDSTAQVALLETIVSEGLFRYDTRLITVFTPAGTVILVARGTIEAVEVGGAVTDDVDGAITVTRTVTV